MTEQRRQRIKQAINRRARAQQSWWDEYEAFIANPVFCTCQQISRDVTDCPIHGYMFQERSAA